MKTQQTIYLLVFIATSWVQLQAQSLTLTNRTPESIQLRLEVMRADKDFSPIDSLVLQSGETKTILRKEPFVSFYRVIFQKKSQFPSLDFIWDEDVTLTIDINYLMRVAGSSLTDTYNEYESKTISPARIILVENTRQSNILRQKGDSLGAIEQLKKNNIIVGSINQQLDSLIRTSKRDFLNLYWLEGRWEVLGIPATKNILAEFEPVWHNHPIYTFILNRIEKIESKGENVQISSFSRTTLTGSTLKLSALKSEYILLDFWGSWCGPCIQSIPKLKNLNANFPADKLTLIGIAGERSVPSKALRKIIATQDIPWPQVEEKLTETGTLITQFNISFFPTYILLDKNLTILKRGGPEIFSEIETLLKK